MAWAGVNQTFTASRTTSGTSLTSGAVTQTVEVGNVHYVAVALDNTSTGDGDNSEVTSVTDSAGNTYTKLGEETNGNGSAGAGATISVWYTIVTTQITASTHTVTCNYSTRTAVCMFGWEFTLSAAAVIAHATGSPAVRADDAADPGSISIGTLASREYLGLRLIASETNAITAFTPTSGWTTLGQALANTTVLLTSMALHGEYKIATATGFASDPTWVSADHASILLVLTEDVPVATGTLAVTLGALAAAGTGIVPAQGIGAATLDALTLLATGGNAASGVLAVTLGALVGSGVGNAPAAAALAVTLDPLTLAGVGAAPVAGALAATLGALTLSATGAVAVVGVEDGTLGPLTLSAIGLVSYPVPDAAVQKEIRVIAFDSFSGSVVGAWTGVVTLDIAFNLHGPEQATIGMAKYMPDGSLNPWLKIDRLAPGNRGALIQVDARAIGVPLVWQGMAVKAPVGNQVTTVGVEVDGPHCWLSEESVVQDTARQANAGQLVLDMFAQHPNQLWMRIGRVHGGPEVMTDFGGGSVMDALDDLEQSTLGIARFSAVAGEPTMVVDWVDQLASRFPDVGRLVLIEDVNCNWSGDTNLVPGTEELILLGERLTDATEKNGVIARAPAGNVLGRQAALSAVVSTTKLTSGGAGGGSAMRPDQGALPSLTSEAEAIVRSRLAPPMVATVEILDEDLWPFCIPGTLCMTQFPSDSLGVWDGAIGEVQQVTFGILPDRRCTLSVELWRRG